MKILVLLTLSLFSFNSFACFSPPEGLREQHEMQATIYFFSASTFLISSLFMRAKSNKTRLWVPLLFISLFTYIPAFLWHVGTHSGSCGMPEIVFAFQVFAGGMFLIFTYEAINFYKSKKQVN